MSIGALSRVMLVCRGIGTGISRRSAVLEPLLMNGHSHRMPGPRVPVYEPNVKITSR